MRPRKDGTERPQKSATLSPSLTWAECARKVKARRKTPQRPPVGTVSRLTKTTHTPRSLSVICIPMVVAFAWTDQKRLNGTRRLPQQVQLRRSWVARVWAFGKGVPKNTHEAVKW